jgi:ubiquinone/menaquinone biosynthesis C-methylase UbiE
VARTPSDGEHPRDHPLFAVLYNGLTWLGERTTLGRWRTEALAPAHGRLLIIGLGPGYDLRHLPPAVTEVIAVEPAASMRRIVRSRLRSAEPRSGERSGPPIRLAAGIGECLPLEAASVDSVLLSLVLCSVDDPAAVLAEVTRVLRPGGVVCVLEHVRAADGTRLARVQDRGAGLWARVAGRCQPNRRTRDALVAAGYDVSELTHRTLRLTVPLLAPTLIGRAYPSGSG